MDLQYLSRINSRTEAFTEWFTLQSFAVNGSRHTQACASLWGCQGEWAPEYRLRMPRPFPCPAQPTSWSLCLNKTTAPAWLKPINSGSRRSCVCTLALTSISRAQSLHGGSRTPSVYHTQLLHGCPKGSANLELCWWGQRHKSSGEGL